jgi:hypothetical protein
VAIVELRILPPLAIGRLGSSEVPLEAFDLEVGADEPLGYRRIVPRPTFRVDPATGELSCDTPASIRFKEEDGRVRPLAPFLQVFAVTDTAPEELQPLTLDLLASEGLDVGAISWTVEVGNIKVFRRTGQPNDKAVARVVNIRDHALRPLLAECPNFLAGKRLPLGSVRFIRPTKEFPGIRLRFTPAAGKVYGASRKRIPGPGLPPVDDPVITSDDLVLYDMSPGKGTWLGYTEPNLPTLTNPAAIYAGFSDADDNQVSWGYLDDECDGTATVSLDLGGGRTLTAHAHFGAGPPAYAPDTLPVRVVSDELEQILLGVEAPDDVPIDEAEEIVRRALETVRHMNTAVMNGNAVDGRPRVASTMSAQDTNDFERYYEPIMATSLVDNLAVRALHERVFNGIAAGTAPWFSDVLRRPEEIGDLSNAGRRKMPALMRNADGRALTLTRRQVDTVIKAATGALFAAGPRRAEGASSSSPPAPATTLTPSNRTAQLHHRGDGNPFSVLPRTAISNCFPGLEFDFRNLWRRAFEGIVLLESNNYVVEAEDPAHADLVRRRLLRIDGLPTVVITTGPVFPGGRPQTLATQSNPNAVSFMEWSNSIARVIAKQGQEVFCEFNADPLPDDGEVLPEDMKLLGRPLRLRKFFEGETAAIAAELLRPGELTQGLCSPWQNDYRECACYYWAASRPDYVNVEPGPDGLSRGDLWMSKKRTGTYIPDSRADSRLLSYDDLFQAWEKYLRFIIQGRDAEVS